ncbi:YitT family protein [Lacticaseibacillus nasuensis]|uniref:YitT family protein n=1 Tax=Lacticaseibacillus nasuensis TaxID=944671 RepID=UPI002248007D|nr:YitT family protein [Lacticaseibacillus nasuensis]MCX2454485.1 YitT family protein [Lacticaseibacillus nasuensis]
MTKNTLQSLLKVFLGNAVLGFAYAKLLVPHTIINGGVTSLSLVLSYFIPLRITFFTNFLTVVLLLIGLAFLGRLFFFTSLASSLAYIVFFNLFYNLHLSILTWFPIDFVIAVVLIAFGYYCCLSEDSSTAGLDVFAIICHKYWPQIPTSRYLRYFNMLVLVAGFVSYGWRSVLIGILFSVCFTQLVGWLTHEHREPVTTRN